MLKALYHRLNAVYHLGNSFNRKLWCRICGLREILTFKSDWVINLDQRYGWLCILYPFKYVECKEKKNEQKNYSSVNPLSV